MPRPISLFPSYSTKENRVSNYCGLLFRLIYEERPEAFQELLAGMLDAEGGAGFRVGPQFLQQQRIGGSAVDIAIQQQSFRLAIETKTYDWFHQGQLVEHIKGFSESTEKTALLLLSNFEQDDYQDVSRFQEAAELAEERGILLGVLSFERLLELLDGLRLSTQLEAIVQEFREFLDGQGLLPAWKYLLDVVNCATMSDEVDAGAYMCQNTGGAYSHRRAKWFGMYGNKTVSRIYHIDAVVLVTSDGEEVKWSNVDTAKPELKRLARMHTNAKDWRRAQVDELGVQVFLLSDRADTDFRKVSKGGMLGSKKYFWEEVGKDDTSETLAERLRGREWV